MYRLLVLICVLFSALFSACASNISQVSATDQQLPSLNEAWRVVPVEVQVRWNPLTEQAMGNVGDKGSLEQLRVSARNAAFSKDCDRTKVDQVSFMFLESQTGKIFALRDFTYRFIAMSIRNGRSWKEVEEGYYQMAVIATKESVTFWQSVDLCQMVAAW